MNPLILPDASQVASIEVRISGSYDPKTGEYVGGVIITDKKKITEVIGYINKINVDMRAPLHIAPSGTHKIIFADTSGVNLLLFLGTKRAGWIGGRNNVDGSASDERLTTISETMRSEFLDLLGVVDVE